MELILLILKIILIVFCAVLGFILLALCLILFVPFKYEVSGEIGDAWSFKIKGKVSYLLSAIRILFSYEEEQFDWKLFLFGFEKKRLQEEEIVSDTEYGEKDAEITFREKEPNVTSVQEDIVLQKAVEESAEPDITEPHISEQIEPDEVTESEPEQKEKTGQKVAKKSRTQEASQKSKFDFAFIKRELTDEHNKAVVRKVWSEFCYLFRHFKFRKIKTDFVFATGDPATTGQALGVLCMIPMLYRYEFNAVPDFEADSPYIKGTFCVAGKVRLIHVLMTVLRLILDKEVRIVVKKFIKVLEQWKGGT